MHQQLSKKKQKHHINFYFLKFYKGIKLYMSYLPLFPPPDYCALHNLLPLFLCLFCDNLLSLVRAPHMCMDVEVIYPKMKYPPMVTSLNEEQFPFLLFENFIHAYDAFWLYPLISFLSQSPIWFLFQFSYEFILHPTSYFLLIIFIDSLLRPINADHM